MSPMPREIGPGRRSSKAIPILAPVVAIGITVQRILTEGPTIGGLQVGRRHRSRQSDLAYSREGARRMADTAA